MDLGILNRGWDLYQGRTPSTKNFLSAYHIFCLVWHGNRTILRLTNGARFYYYRL